MDIGGNIRRIREARGLTSTQLAEIVDVSQPMIAQLERGTRVCSLPLAAALAKALGCSVADFIRTDECAKCKEAAPWQS